jgi:heptosyltransferase-2
MCTPVLRAVRERRPQTRISAIVRPGLDDLLRGCPFIDSTIVCDNKGLFGPQRLAKAIKQSDAQAVLLLPNSFRSALGARLSGTPIRIGYDRDGRHAILTHALPPVKSDLPVPMVDYYAALSCFALGMDASAESIDRRIELATTPDEEAAADALLHEVSGPFVALNPGANRADKRWPAERFAALADRLTTCPATDSASPHSVVITGGPGELELLEAIEKLAKRPLINLARRGVTLGSLKAVLRRAAILITNDTGPRHIAAALGTPVVTLFGPTDHRWTTLHLPPDRERILVAEPFLPEELVADQLPKACAIDKIAVEDVVMAVQAMLRVAPSAPARSGNTATPRA